MRVEAILRRKLARADPARDRRRERANARSIPRHRRALRPAGQEREPLQL